METGFKGTPGKWRVVEVVDHPSEKNEQIAFIQTDNTCMDLVAVKKMSRDEFKANAQLIAAAPEMLESLVRIKAELLRCDVLDEKTEKFIDAIVAKVTGGHS